MAVGIAKSAHYGNRLIPQILDGLASAEPGRILYSVAKSSDISQGFRDVSARAFTKAVDKTAWLLRRELGESPEMRAVGYIGPRKFLSTRARGSWGVWALAPASDSSLSTDETHLHLDDLRQILLTYACIKANCTVRSSSLSMCLKSLCCLTDRSTGLVPLPKEQHRGRSGRSRGGKMQHLGQPCWWEVSTARE